MNRKRYVVPKFQIGDSVIFKGTKGSKYGHKASLNKYIGNVVVITDIHPGDNDPPAYLIKESNDYWCDEGCFEFVQIQDLPEFEVCEEEALFSLFA